MTNPTRLSADRQRVLGTCRELRIPVIDIQSRFPREPRLAARYCYPFGGHYTEEGYTFVGRMIRGPA